MNEENKKVFKEFVDKVGKHVMVANESNNLDELKDEVYKAQVAFDFDYDESIFDELNITHFSKQGSVSNLIIKEDLAKAKEIINSKNPVLFDILPLTLEEIFTEKMKDFGYDFSEILEDINTQENPQEVAKNEKQIS